MNKAQLIETLLQQCPDWKKPRVAEVVDLVFDRIMEQLRAGQKVEISGFGSFRIRHRRAKEGRNPKTGVSVAVAEKRVPFYKCGEELKALLNPPTAASVVEGRRSISPDPPL